MNMPDLGTIQITRTHKRANGLHYEFEGLADDFDKLEEASSEEYFSEMATGSICFTIDDSKTYKYEKSTETWYEVNQ